MTSFPQKNFLACKNEYCQSMKILSRQKKYSQWRIIKKKIKENSFPLSYSCPNYLKIKIKCFFNPIPRCLWANLFHVGGGSFFPPPLTSSFLKIETWNLVTMFIVEFWIKVTSSTMPDFWLDNRLFVKFRYFRS